MNISVQYPNSIQVYFVSVVSLSLRQADYLCVVRNLEYG